MLDPNLYIGREQTYVKHFVLKHYLERVAYNIYSFATDFAYVDGFSGPWKSIGESLQDTSFQIALDQLRSVRDGLKDRSKIVKFRCLFVEKSRAAYVQLEEAVKQVTDVNILTINGPFENHVADVKNFIGNTFSLIFIDPTGWQGFPLEGIKPLLKLRGEVLINFMSDYINRFIADPRPEIAKSFDALFGPNWFPEWKALHDSGLSREAAAIEVYTGRLKSAGNFAYVTFTRILKPTADRSYFYLIYATQHWKGVQEFRGIEKKAIDEQEHVRNAAKYNADVERTNQESLWGGPIIDTNLKSYDLERTIQLKRGHKKLLNTLAQNPRGIRYELLLGAVLETSLVWESDLKDWIGDLKKAGKIVIPDLPANQRVPKKGNLIRLVSPSIN